MSARAWIGGEYGLVGDDAVQARMHQFAEASPAIAARVLLDEAVAQVEGHLESVPLGASPADAHPGALRASGRAVLVDRSPSGLGAHDLAVAVAFGGSDVPYAIAQEMRGRYKHPHGGHAHYFQELLDAAIATLLTNVVGRLEDDLQSLGATV